MASSRIRKGMEEFDSIQVDRPVFIQFQTILMETQLTSNSLMKYFFKLYKSSLKRTSFENCDQVASNGILHDVKGGYFNKLVVNIPRNLLRQDISVNVTIPDFDSCNSTDSDSSEDGSTPRPLIVSGKMENGNVEKTKTTPRYENPDQVTYSCKQCAFKTKGFRKFQRHTRKHENQYNCPYCNQKFFETSKLSNHIKNRHENEQFTKINCHDIDKKINMVQLSDIDIEMNTSLSDTNNSLTLNQNDISNKHLMMNCESDALKRGDNLRESGEINLNQYSIIREDNLDNPGEITNDLCAAERGDNKVTNATMGKLSAKTENNLVPVKNKISMENGHSKTTSSIQGMPYRERKKRLKNKGKVNESTFQQDFRTCDYPKTQGNKIFNCKCKRKFKWKSLFLCHKKSCGYVKMLKQRSIQKNSFIKISSTRNIHDACTKSLELSIDSSEPQESRNKHIPVSSENSRINGADMEKMDIPTNGKFSSNLNESDINSVREGNDDTLKENVCSSAERYENSNNQRNHMSDICSEKNHHQNDPSNYEIEDFDIGLQNCESDMREKVSFSEGVNIDRKQPLELHIGNSMLQNITECATKTDKSVDCNNSHKMEIQFDLSCVKEEPVETENQDNLPVSVQDLKLLNDEKMLDYLKDINSDKMVDNTSINQIGRLALLDTTMEENENLKCEDCGEIFKKKAYLKEHMEGKHRGGYRYSCECGKKFKWRSSLGSHRKHCFPTMISNLTPNFQIQGQGKLHEGQGQNVSVIDFSHCSTPYMNLKNEWRQEIEKWTTSSVQGAAEHNMSSYERTKISENEYSAPRERRKSDSICRKESIASLRFDTSLVKPIAEALSKYKKPSISHENLEIANIANKSARYDSANKIDPRRCSDSLDVCKNHSNGINKTENSSSINHHMLNSVGSNYSKAINTSTHSTKEIKLEPKTEMPSNGPHWNTETSQRKKSLPNNKAMDCLFCKEKFYDIIELEKHKLFCKHLQDTCSVCGMTFQHRTDLVNHLLKSHGNDETYTCYCEFNSTDWSVFEAHCENCKRFQNQIKKSITKSPSSNGTRNSIDQADESALDTFLHGSKKTSIQSTRQQFQSIYPHPQLSFTQIVPQNMHASLKSNVDNLKGYQTKTKKTDQIQTGSKPLTPILPKTTANILPTISSFVMADTKTHFDKNLIAPPSLHTDNFDISRSIKGEPGLTNAFVCTFCGNVFNDLEQFTEHNRIHHKHKSMKNDLDAVMNKSQHLPPKRPEHICHFCGDVFAAKAYLKEHVHGKHGAVERYQCPCGLKFKWRSSLGIHQKRCPKSNKRTYNRWNST